MIRRPHTTIQLNVMAKIFASGLFLCLVLTAPAQQTVTPPPTPMTPASEVIDRMTAAWNAHDTCAFAAFLHPQILLRDVGRTKVLRRGRAAFEQSAANFFAKNPQAKVEILRRITEGAFVIDYERISGLANGQARESTIILEVRNDLVVRMWGLPEDAQ
jgi:hypothetical protein